MFVIQLTILDDVPKYVGHHNIAQLDPRNARKFSTAGDAAVWIEAYGKPFAARMVPFNWDDHQ